MSYLTLGWTSDQGQATSVNWIGYRKIIGRVFGMKYWHDDEDKWKNEAKLCGYHDKINNKTLYPEEVWMQPPWEVWVSYYIRDKSCDPYLGQWQKNMDGNIGVCNDNVKQYKAIVYNIPYSNDGTDTWSLWSNQIQANINGVKYKPTRIEKNLLNVWAVYDVPDKYCSGKYEESNDVGHHIEKNVQQIEKLTWSLEDFFTGIFSNKYSFYIIAGILIVGGLVYLKSKT